MTKLVNILKNQINFYILTVLLISLFVFLLLPIYDRTNSLHNLFFEEYKIIWYDGRSPANFYTILRIMKNEPILFPKGFLIDNMKVENLFDFTKKEKKIF